MAQNFETLTPNQIEREAHAYYNRCGVVPVHQWLRLEQSEEDRKRLAAMGNCVMPRCARLGLTVIAKGLPANGECPFYAD